MHGRERKKEKERWGRKDCHMVGMFKVRDSMELVLSGPLGFINDACLESVDKIFKTYRLIITNLD